MKRGVGRGGEKRTLEAGKEERDPFFLLFFFLILVFFSHFFLVCLCGMVYVCIWYGMCVYVWCDICMVGCMHVLVSMCAHTCLWVHGRAWANGGQKCTPAVFLDCSPPTVSSLTSYLSPH